ncbi:hypothetical protein BH10PAT3_BH10PAT3_2470 [soil metagenome]
MNLRNLFKKPAIKKALLGLAIVAAVAIPAAARVSHAKAGYGPDRPRIYDWNVEADRTGALTPTFNSFINTPVYGDERNFTRVAPVVAGQNAVDADYSHENVSANADGEYWVRVYVHNNANQDLNDAAHNFVGVATNTKVRVAIADGQANGVDVMGYISADNATPERIWDSGTLVNDTQKFSVTYENGSAMIVNQAHLTGAPLSDDVMSANGTQIGYDQMDGKLPGCFQYSAYVFVKVKVNTPKTQIAKTVRITGADTWVDTQAVKPGDKISYQLAFSNKGSAVADNVTVRDALPNGLTLDPGSITYVSPTYPNGKILPDTALTSGGTNVTSLAPGAEVAIYYRAVVGQPADDTCEIVNTAFVKSDSSAENSDTAKVTYDQALCKKPVVSYECTLLALTQDKTNSHKVVTNITAGHDSTTKVASYVIDFGDGTTPITTNTNPYTYTYQKDGTFNIVAKVNFTLADTTPKNNIAGDKCIGRITTTTVSTPTTTLPNTGAGSMIAVFGTTTVLGAFLYRMRALRGLK